MTSNQAKVVQPLRIADARNAVRHVFIRDYMVNCSIGIHSHEKEHDQRVRINLDLAVWEGETPINDDIRNVICYEHLAKRIERIVGEGRLGLLGINILVIFHLGYYVTTKDFYCLGSCWEINVQVHSGLFIVLMLLVIYQDKERSIIRTDIVCVQSNK